MDIKEARPCKGKTRKNQSCKLKTLSDSGFCFIHKKQEILSSKDEVLEKKEKKILKNIRVVKNDYNLSEENTKLKNIILDITSNNENWKVLFSMVIYKKHEFYNRGKTLHDDYKKILFNENDINTLKQTTQNIVQRDYKFSDFINHISLYNEQLQIMENERQSLTDELTKISKSIKNFNELKLYYDTKLHYENKHPFTDINKFRIGTYESYNCIICLETDTKGLVLDCGHKFHIKCILEHFCNSDKLYCPMCRSELKAENIMPISVGITISEII